MRNYTHFCFEEHAISFLSEKRGKRFPEEEIEETGREEGMKQE